MSLFQRCLQIVLLFYQLKHDSCSEEHHMNTHTQNTILSVSNSMNMDFQLESLSFHFKTKC